MYTHYTHINMHLIWSILTGDPPSLSTSYLVQFRHSLSY